MIYVIEFDDSVPYEACWVTTFPIEFDGSMEELKFEFELASEKQKDNKKPFKFNQTVFPRRFHEYFGRKWNYYPPKFFTIEEWIKDFQKRQKDEHSC